MACANGPEIAQQTTQSQSIGAGVARIQREAQAVRMHVRSGWANEYLDATARLSGLAPRRIGAETIDEVGFYYGGGDSPAFFARFLDIFGENEARHLISRRILEVNYSAIGPLRILATAGALAVGVSPTTVQTVGGGYDAVVVKNLLKRGLIHPTDEAGAATRVNLGVSDEEYLDHLIKLLRPGGRLLAYNLCPPPPPAGYNPEADCRSPFPQTLWQAAGFRVRDYDRVDTPAARTFAQALGMAPDLHATYTFVERP
jgi:hypothetical protein